MTAPRSLKSSTGLRIAMVSTPFVSVPPKQYGGTELVVAELIDGLTETGAQVTLFATGDSTGGYRELCPVRARFDAGTWPPSFLIEMMHSAFAFRELVERFREFDVIHAHCPTFLPLASMLPIPVVYTIHHPFHEELSRLYREVGEVAFVAISARQARLCGPFEDCTVIHHGVDADRYRLGPVRPDMVAFLSRLSEVKAPHIAIEVATRAALNIRVAGRPHEDDRAYFQSRVAPLLRQPNVEWVGEVGHGAKVELLSSARALLFPIEWEEPFGLVAIEAMLCGCPVVAFGRGSLPELVEQGVTGFIARDPDDMVRLLHGPAAPERFDRERCRARATRRFSSKRMVDDYRRLYERVRDRAFAPVDVGASHFTGV